MNAPQGFRSVPQSFSGAPSFSMPRSFGSAPPFSPFRGGVAPSGSRYHPAAPGAHSPYPLTGIHPVPRPPVRYPHSYNFGSSNRPGSFHHDRERLSPDFGLLAYPVLVGPGYWPYDSSYDGFVDPAYNDPVYNNISNDGVAPEALQAPAYSEDPGYPGPPPPPESTPPPAPMPPAGPEMQYVPGSADTVTLIFRDGRAPEEIHNYLATRTTLTVLDGHRRREIPIADLDLAATLKANRETGVDFQLPAGR